jgi:Putative prokaryotic signal transducing protein
MTILSNNLPGWFKRRQPGGEEAAGETPDAAEETPDAGTASGAVPISAVTGGGSSQEPVVVWEAANLMEAQVVKGRLESEGIPAFIRTEALGVIYGLTAGNLARAEVLVPGLLATKAVELLGDESGGEEAPDTPEDVEEQ